MTPEPPTTPASPRRSYLGVAGGVLSALHAVLLFRPIADVAPAILDLSGLLLWASQELLEASACGSMLLLVLIALMLLVFVFALAVAAAAITGFLAMLTAAWFGWAGHRLGLFAGAALNGLTAIGWALAGAVDRGVWGWRLALVAALPLTAAVLLSAGAWRTPDEP